MVVAEAALLLVDGVGSSGVALVASLGTSEARAQTVDLIDDAIEELRFRVLRYGDTATDLLAAARVRQLLLEDLGVREVTARVRRQFGHCDTPEIDALAYLHG